MQLVFGTQEPWQQCRPQFGGIAHIQWMQVDVIRPWVIASPYLGSTILLCRQIGIG